MFEKLIVATDLSPASLALTRSLGALKPKGARHCLLLYCFGLHRTGSFALSYAMDVVESSLTKHREILEAEGFDVETRILPGVMKQEIDRIAVDESYDLIVVGDRAHTLTGEAYFNGLAYELIHHARRPVMVVRLEEKKEEEKIHVRARGNLSGHLLFPTDFSDNAHHAFRRLKELITPELERVTLLHIVDEATAKQDSTPDSSTMVKEAEERLAALKIALSKEADVPVAIKVVTGHPTGEILDFLAKEQVDLVVMGSQGHGFLRDLFLGSVSHNIARHAPCSVLLIPAER